MFWKYVGAFLRTTNISDTKVCYIRKKAYLCTAIKDGSVAQLDRATPF